MKFEEALPLMRKGIVCTCDGVSWTVNEKHEWLRWYGTSFRIDSGPSNDQILGGDWQLGNEPSAHYLPDNLKKFSTSNAEPVDLASQVKDLTDRLDRLEWLHGGYPHHRGDAV